MHTAAEMSGTIVYKKLPTQHYKLPDFSNKNYIMNYEMQTTTTVHQQTQ